MNSTLFDFSPLYEYKVDDMLNNIKIMKKTFESIKLVINNFTNNVHDIHNNLLNSPRSRYDVMSSIDQFKAIQHDFISNVTSLALYKLSDDKDSINYSYHNKTSGDNIFSTSEYWALIHKIPFRTFTVLFNDSSKLSVLHTPSIQVNLDLNNRHFSLKYFTNKYNKEFEINSSNLSKVIKYVNDNDDENTEVAVYNLIRFYESIFNRTNVPDHDLHLLDSKLDLVIHELNRVEKLVKLRKATN